MAGIHSKKQQSPEQIAAVLQAMGIDVSVEEIVESRENTEERKMLAEEGTLLTLANKPHKLVQRKCKECGEIFATDYLYVAYCGAACRTTALRKYGLTHKNGTYGRQHDPIIIPPESLNSLRKLLAVEIHDNKIKVSKEVSHQCSGQLELPLFDDVPLQPANVEQTLHQVHQQLGLEESHKSAELKEIDSLLAGLSF